MIKNIILLGALMVTSTCAVKTTITVPLKKPIVIDATSFTPAFKGGIDLTVLKQAGNEWFDTIVQLVNGLVIPDVTTSGKDYMYDNTFYIEERIDNVDLTADTTQNAVVLNCKKLTAKFRCNDFKYKIAPLVIANGYVEVDMNSVDIGFGLQFKTQISPTSGR